MRNFLVSVRNEIGEEVAYFRYTATTPAKAIYYGLKENDIVLVNGDKIYISELNYYQMKREED